MITQEALEEALDLIVEECGEVVVARSKLRRFGPDSRDPAKPDDPDNWEALKIELLDVHALIGRIISRAVLITPGEAETHAARKIAKVKRLHPSLENFL